MVLKMKVICAWCRKPMDEYATTEEMLSVIPDTSSRWLDPTEQLPELVSHGICDRCAAKLEAEIDDMAGPDERECEAWCEKQKQQGGTK